MGTWAAFFIKTNKLDRVTEKLQDLSGIDTVSTGEFPTEDLYNNILLADNAEPTYMVFAQTQPGWVMVRHNALQNLEDWGEELSRHFQSLVIIAGAQSNADFYHFSLYEKGTLQREIEYCYGDDTEPVNEGNKFEFEGDQPGKRMEYDDEESFIFDFDSIEEYAKHFGLEVQPDYDKIATWTILKTNTTQKTLGDFRKQLKPWWKFW